MAKKKESKKPVEIVEKKEVKIESKNSEAIEKKSDIKEKPIAKESAPKSDTEPEKKTQKAKPDKKNTKVKVSKQTKKISCKKTKSKKYLETVKDINRGQEYPINDAIKLAKKSSYSKFDGTLTVHIKLSRSKKGDEAIRGTIKLPHGTDKVQKIEIVTEELIEKIQKGYSDFDLLICSPQMMPKLAQVAKILGPKGKMPNPKDGTIVENPEEAIKELDQIAQYRMDIGRNLHICVGKVSWENTKNAENIVAVLKALTHLKKDSVTLSPTMGAGVKIAL